MNRRRFFATPLLAVAAADAPAVQYPQVIPGSTLAFPRDHGSHPQFRTEWWYITGAVGQGSVRDHGIQITFFRSRPGVAESVESAFAPRQLLFAHAAVAEPRYGRLRHDQRVARAGFGLAEAATETTDVWINDWALQLVGDRYVTRIAAREFAFDLAFTPTQPILLNGNSGISRKGPNPVQASYYYSRPQLLVQGHIDVDGKRRAINGIAWLDHEWSSQYLASEAVGWDWAGINFVDGGALMAFQIRGKDGRAYWAGGTLRSADGRVTTFAPDDVRFAPLRKWRSPRTNTQYPVSVLLRTGSDEWTIDALMDDQELDSRASTGTIYWEGLVRLSRRGTEVGRGYLELTGYWQPLKL